MTWSCFQRSVIRSALLAVSRPAFGRTQRRRKLPYPSRSIRIVSPLAAGSVSDISLHADSMHCHNGGRPIITVIYQIFTCIAQFPDVWFASHGEIASWVIKNKFESNPLRLLKA